MTSLRADLWAHGTAISPAIVALVFLGLFATIATRPTRGGRRSALWLAILAGAMLVAGLAEPAQQQAILFGAVDEATAVDLGVPRRPDRPDPVGRRRDAPPE